MIWSTNDDDNLLLSLLTTSPVQENIRSDGTDVPAMLKYCRAKTEGVGYFDTFCLQHSRGFSSCTARSFVYIESSQSSWCNESSSVSEKRKPSDLRAFGFLAGFWHGWSLDELLVFNGTSSNFDSKVSTASFFCSAVKKISASLLDQVQAVLTQSQCCRDEIEQSVLPKYFILLYERVGCLHARFSNVF